MKMLRRTLRILAEACRWNTLLTLLTIANAEVWRQEVGSQMSIGAASAGGYKRVALRCGADYMQVAVETDGDFDGVIYTRGSFHERRAPCFLDPKGGRAFVLRFPLHQCHTKHEDDTYSNVVVVQYDDELIMPGDAAFALQCDFSRPRDVTVSADLAANRGGVKSRISLVDADPAGAASSGRHRRATVANASDEVAFHPSDAYAPPRKDEL